MAILKDLLKGYKITLASLSPRRAALLKGLDIDFEVEVIGVISEDYDLNTPLFSVPQMLADRKSLQFGRELREREILITADTLVICNDKIIEKPQNRDEAFSMLKFLSGRSHIVATGVTLRSRESGMSFLSKSKVWFKEIDDDEIYYYIDNYSPYDKAGSYGAQDWFGYTVISRIEGSYFNVVGLPVQQLSDKLKEFICSF